jgi:hypothetical protein
MVKNGRFQTVPQTFDELKRFGPPYDILKNHREIFQISIDKQFDPRVSAYIETLGNEAPYLWKQTGGRNRDPADPWMAGSDDSTLTAKSLAPSRPRCIRSPIQGCFRRVFWTSSSKNWTG